MSNCYFSYSIRMNSFSNRLGHDQLAIVFIFFISKSVLPQIQPFTFGDDAINSGETVSIQCTVLKGDPPLNITWLLNGHPIRRDDGVNVMKMKRFSTLNIDSVQNVHSGNYTCVVENPAGSDSFSTNLNVNGTIFCWFCFNSICTHIHHLIFFDGILQYRLRSYRLISVKSQ